MKLRNENFATNFECKSNKLSICLQIPPKLRQEQIKKNSLLNFASAFGPKKDFSLCRVLTSQTCKTPKSPVWYIWQKQKTPSVKFATYLWLEWPGCASVVASELLAINAPVDELLMGQLLAPFYRSHSASIESSANWAPRLFGLSRSHFRRVAERDSNANCQLVFRNQNIIFASNLPTK